MSRRGKLEPVRTREEELRELHEVAPPEVLKEVRRIRERREKDPFQKRYPPIGFGDAAQESADHLEARLQVLEARGRSGGGKP